MVELVVEVVVEVVEVVEVAVCYLQEREGSVWR